MKKLKKTLLIFVVGLIIMTGSMLMWDVVGNSTPTVDASIDDKMDLCLTLHTYVAGPNEGLVDWRGFWHCVRVLM